MGQFPLDACRLGYTTDNGRSWHRQWSPLTDTLIDWVEYGKEPLPNSSFNYSHDNAVTLAPTAVERSGLQPVVSARANGSARADISPGGEVVLEADVEVPPGAGRVTAIEWDPEGTGAYPVREDGIDGTETKRTTRLTHTYSAAGTYFPAVRVTAHRDGDPNASLFRLHNLGRVRVVVR